MGGWWKCDDEIVTNAKIGRAVSIAGEHAALVYVALLCLHSKHGSGGLIPQSHCEPDGLQFEAGAFLSRVSVKRIASALEACVQARLITRDPAGIRVSGFTEQHMPECSRCHQPNPEPSHGNCPDCRRKKTEARRRRAAESLGDDERAGSSVGEGSEGHAHSARSTARPANRLQDRKGREGKGKEEKGEEAMDGRMDGGSPCQDQKGEGAGTPVPRSGPELAGDVAGRVLRAVAQ